jgi:hypothetical protein
VSVVLLHLGGVRLRGDGTGPVRDDRRRRRGVVRSGAARTVIPIHYEGWKHFREGRSEIERELASGPADVRERFRWLAIGASAEVEV